METENITPQSPPALEGNDGSAELMEAIARHADAARALAAIAGGADPREVLGAWLAETEPEPEPGPQSQTEEQPAIYQSSTPFSSVDDSWPACLGTPSSGFWDNLQFI